MRIAADHTNFVACMQMAFPIGRQPAQLLSNACADAVGKDLLKSVFSEIRVRTLLVQVLVSRPKNRPLIDRPDRSANQSSIVFGGETTWTLMSWLWSQKKLTLGSAYYYFSVIEERRKVPGVEWAKTLFYWHQQFHFAKYQHMYYFRDTGYYAWAMKIAPITMKQWF